MAPAQRFLFDDFLLDVGNRSLLRAGSPIELNSRYFDALALLVRARGDLVGKQRFMDEVWGDTVVTDAALTQCIKDVRRALGDDAANPRFVRTVPGHGYKFIAPVREEGKGEAAAAEVAPPIPAALTNPIPAAVPGSAPRGPLASPVPRFLTDSVAGTLGGGIAGIFVGLLYGSALASSPAAQGIGTSTVLLVLLALNVVAGLAGGFGVALGIAAGRLIGPHPAWTVAGAAVSGLVIGGLLKIVGSDAFTLLFGRAPGGITGGLEGAAIGIAIAGGALLAGTLDAPSRWRPVIGAGVASGIAGVLITMAGGRLMGGSLERLSGAFADSRLDLDPLGRFFGEAHFGDITQVVLGTVEGLLFGACVAAAIVLARRGVAGVRAAA